MEDLEIFFKVLLEKSKLKFLKLLLEDIKGLNNKIDNNLNNLKPEDTGLDTIIWIMPQSDLNNLQHSNRRIKVSDQNNPNGNNQFPIIFNKSIDDTNIIDKLKLGKNSKRKLKQWLFKNKDLLIKYTNKEINFKTLLNSIEKVE